MTHLGTEPGIPYAAPPTSPGTLGTSKTSWPSTVGVIAIILGALGILGGLWGLLTPFIADLVAKFIPNGQSGMEAIANHRWLMVAVALVSLSLAILLTVGGSALMRRKASGRGLLLLWSGIKCVEVISSAGITYVMQQEQFEFMTKSQGTPMPAGLTSVIGIFTIIFSLAFGFAFPVFLMIWLSRRVIKDEVSSWAPPAPAPL